MQLYRNTNYNKISGWMAYTKKKNIWATTCIYGNFFVWFRTTSHYEQLHAQLAKFEGSDHNLIEFVEHFQRVIHYKRYKEVQADFKSIIDTLVALTEFVSIVRSIGKLYTCSKCFKMFFVPHLLLVLCMVGRFVDHKV